MWRPTAVVTDHSWWEETHTPHKRTGQGTCGHAFRSRVGARALLLSTNRFPENDAAFATDRRVVKLGNLAAISLEPARENRETLCHPANYGESAKQERRGSVGGIERRPKASPTCKSYLPAQRNKDWVCHFGRPFVEMELLSEDAMTFFFWQERKCKKVELRAWCVAALCVNFLIIRHLVQLVRGEQTRRAHSRLTTFNSDRSSRFRIRRWR